MRLILLPGLLLAASAAAAQSPDDFAWQWPLVVDANEGAHTLLLDEAVYARTTRADLRDLAVFNADGQLVPFAPLPVEHATTEQRRELRWLRLPAAPADAPAGDFSLRLARDADGNLRDLQIDSEATAATSPSTDLLIDLGEKPESVSSLKLTLAADAALPVNLRAAVLASSDLAQWQVLGSNLAVVAIDDNGLRIERLRLDFAPSSQRYLRLSLERGDWPALARIEDERRETGPALPPWQTLELQGTAVAGEPGVFEYRSAGPFPVGRVDLGLPQANTVATAWVESRDDAEAYWEQATAFTAFRLGGNGDEVRHLPADTRLQRNRQWRVRTQPALSQAPVLKLSYQPDRFVLLSQGPAPYRLLAGSARATRPDFPVSAALTAASASRPDGWVPPNATLGTGGPAAGDIALAPDRGPQYRRWVLWAVLALGAGLVLVVALKVLRGGSTTA